VVDLDRLAILFYSSTRVAPIIARASSPTPCTP